MSLSKILGDFYPILLVFQGTGLIYFDSREPLSKRLKSGKFPSKSFCVYFLSLVLALCGLSIFTIWVFLFKEYDEDGEQEYIMDKFVVSSILVGIFAASYSTIIESFCTWHKHLAFFEKITEIDNHLSVVAPNQNYSRIHKYILLRVSFSFFIIFLIHLVQLYIAFATDFRKEMIRFWMTAGIPILLIALTTCKYLFYLLMIQTRMLMVSETMEKILDENEPRSFPNVIEVKAKSATSNVMERVALLRKGITA